jgi:hypothetical protein
VSGAAPAAAGCMQPLRSCSAAPRRRCSAPPRRPPPPPALSTQLPTADTVEYWRSADKAGWLQSQADVTKLWRKRWFVLKQGFLFRWAGARRQVHPSRHSPPGRTRRARPQQASHASCAAQRPPAGRHASGGTDQGPRPPPAHTCAWPPCAGFWTTRCQSRPSRAAWWTWARCRTCATGAAPPGGPTASSSRRPAAAASATSATRRRSRWSG